MDIWGPSRHARPRGLAVGDAWGTAFALPVVKADMQHPVNVVEDALLPETKISFREAHLDCQELPPPPRPRRELPPRLSPETSILPDIDTVLAACRKAGIDETNDGYRRACVG